MHIRKNIFILTGGVILLLCCGAVCYAGESTLELDLDDCIELGFEHNPEILKAKQEIRKSHSYLMENFANFIPSIHLEYNYIDTSSPQLGGGVASEYFLYARSAAGLHVKQAIFRGGEYYYKYRRAKLDLEKSKEFYMAVRDELIFDIKNAYYDLLLTENLILLNTKSKGRMEAYALKIKRKSQVGDVHKYEILRSNIEIENTGVDIINLEKERLFVEAKLKKLLMVKDTDSISIKGELVYSDDQAKATYSLDSVFEQAREANRKLKVAELSRDIGKESISVMSSRYSPAASVRAGFYETSDELSINSRYRYDWSLMFNVRVPIFDGCKIASLVSQSKSEYSKLKIAEEALKKDIFWDLEEAIADLEKTIELLKKQKRLANNAQTAVNMVWILYDRGEVVQWDMIDAHKNYIRAESNLSRFIRDYNVLTAKIEYLTGE